MTRLTIAGNFCEIACCTALPCVEGCDSRAVYEKLRRMEDLGLSDRWHNAETETPEQDEMYLTVNENGNYAIMGYDSKELGWYEANSGGFECSDPKWWMPLPVKPKDGD